MKEHSYDFDSTDNAILDLLAENARRTFGDIGRHVGLSAPAAKRRVDRMEREGFIRGYTIKRDYAKMGRPLEAFVEVNVGGAARVDTIEKLADNIPEVDTVFTIAGNPDALIWIRARDVQDLKRVIDQLRGNGPVIGTKTLMVLGSSYSSLMME